MVNINERLNQGYIHARCIIEMAGKPKEHIEQTMGALLDTLKENKNIDIISKEIADAEEIKDQEGFFSTFAELELLFKNIPAMVGFCFDYMPSSIEVLAPEEMKFKQRELSQILNELQGKLHTLNSAVKKFSMENNFLKSNINVLIKNIISILLVKKGRKCEDLAKVTGFKKEDLQAFLDQMVKENKLKKEGEVYSLVKNE